MSNLHARLFDARRPTRSRTSPPIWASAASSRERPGPDELLAELQEVLRQLPEGDVRRRREGGERLGLSLPAQARRACLRHHARLRDDEPGQDERLYLPGLQSAAVGAEPRPRCRPALSKLKFLVGMDPLQTETARFWENHGEYNDVKPEEIQTDGLRTAHHLLRRGRGLAHQFRALAAMALGRARTPPGEAKTDIWIMAQLYKRLKALYQKEGGAFPDPILNLTWHYANPDEPTAAGARQGDQRQRAGGSAGPGGPDQGAAPEGQAAAPVSPNCATTARRRAAAGSTPAATPRRATTWPAATRPTRATPAPISNGRSPGPPTAASSTTAPRPTFEGKPWDPSAQAHRMGRRQMDRLRRARHRADGQAGAGAALHHEPGGHRPPVGPRH